MTKRRRLIRFLTALAVLLLLAVCAHAEEILTISPSWQGFTSPDGQGLYHDLIRAAFKSEGASIKHQEVPAKRGRIMLSEGHADIYMCGTIPLKGVQMAELPMYEGEFHALFLTRMVPDWSGMASLKDRKLVWRIGYYSPRDFTVPVQFEETPTGTEALIRVLRGSADFYIDDVHLIRETINASPAAIDASEYRIESAGFRQYFPLFTLSERGQRLRETFENRMRTLALQGKLLPIYEKWGLPMPRIYSGPQN
jgi:hypothetical protein